MDDVYDMKAFTVTALSLYWSETRRRAVCMTKNVGPYPDILRRIAEVREMRLPWLKTRRWIINTALVGGLCWSTSRADALKLRAEFHAEQKQNCLQQAEFAERQHHWMEQDGRNWCGSIVHLIDIAQDYEEVPELRERAAYHAAMELMYRQASRHPWQRMPAEKPFIPDDRLRTADWLLAKAKAYRELEQQRRRLARLWAQNPGGSGLAEQQIQIADRLASTASYYDCRATLVREFRAQHWQDHRLAGK